MCGFCITPHAQMLGWPFFHCPCPLARDLGSRVLERRISRGSIWRMGDFSLRLISGTLRMDSSRLSLLFPSLQKEKDLVAKLNGNNVN